MTLPDSLYRHRPLRSSTEIRLLQIDRSISTQYSIVSFELQDAPSYDAVSYVWGQQTRSHRLILSDGRHLPITATVAHALPYITKVCQVSYLWIDQITIDQSDIAERNAQVKIMGQIYRQSHRCLIWLESDRDLLKIDSDLGLRWEYEAGEDVRKTLQQFDARAHGHESPQLTSDEEPAGSVPMSRVSSGEAYRVREHLLWFLEHPWFKRVWVYQEFLLSRDVMFIIGNFVLPLDEVRQVFKSGYLKSSAWFEAFTQTFQLDPARATLFQKAPGLDFLLSAFQSREDGTSFILNPHCVSFAHYESIIFAHILNTMAASEAQDDHDHAYAFLGLAPFLLQRMTVDYTLSIEQAFAATMKALVLESKCLDFMDGKPSADIGKSRFNMPSWVPNWTVKAIHAPILCHDNLFDASGAGYGLPQITRCHHFNSSPVAWNELQVAGRIIDTVQYKLKPFSVYQANPTHEIDSGKCSTCLPWHMSTVERFLVQLDDLSTAARACVDERAILRTMFMDGVQWAAMTASESEEESLYRVKPEIIDGVRHNAKMEDLITALVNKSSDLPHGATVSLLHDLSRVQYRRRLVYCTGSKLALALDDIDAGDMIAILHGARVPFVLRPRRDGKFSVIGQCFYDGAMYGELADAVDENADVFTLV